MTEHFQDARALGGVHCGHLAQSRLQIGQSVFGVSRVFQCADFDEFEGDIDARLQNAANHNALATRANDIDESGRVNAIFVVPWFADDVL